MLVGTVCGNATAIAKSPALEGVRLMLVRLESGSVSVASDIHLSAGFGDRVYLLTSKEAAASLGVGMVGVDLAIAGIIDE